MTALLLAFLAAAVDVGHEAVISADGVGHVGQSRVAAGVGGGLGYRLHLDRYAAGILVDGLTLSVPALSVTVGAGRTWRINDRHDLGLGLELGAIWGQVRVVTTEQPLLARGPAVSLRAVVRPIVLHLDNHDVSLLELSYGRGLDDPGHAQAFRLGLLAIGRRW